MSCKLLIPGTDILTLEELVYQLDTIDFDPAREDSIRAAAPYLKALSNNRTFLADFVITRLKGSFSSSGSNNNYVPQVIMLNINKEKDYIIRANIWPSREDSVYKSSGNSAFSYGLAHDHNFNLLTVGYFGPGYKTELYEYDHDSVSGYKGEKVNLKYLGETLLKTGDVMLYRAHRDVHIQRPPVDMSISLNLMESGKKRSFTNQYEFNVENSTIQSVRNKNLLQALIQSAAHLDPDGSREILIDLSEKHPCEDVRFEAIKARANCSDDLESSINIIDNGLMSGSKYVRESCKLYRSHIEHASILSNG